MQKLTTIFNLTNAKCAGCVSKIQTSLNRLDFVKSAQVNLLDKSLYVEYSELKHDNEVIETLGKLGYEARLDSYESETANLWITVGLPFTVGALIMALGMIKATMPDFTTLNGLLIGIAEAFVSLTILLSVGRKILAGGWNGLLTLSFNMYSLILLGVGSAWLYSTLVVIFSYLKQYYSTGVYFESSLVILALVNLGNYLEERAKSNTSEAIRSLSQMVPEFSSVVVDGQEQQLATNLLRTGYLVKVRPGEKLAADGEVIEGTSYVDESMLTGEPLAVRKIKGDNVISGSINKSGTFIFRVNAVGGQTLLAGIINLVKSAQMSKPPLAKLADKVAQVFVPLIISIASISAILWFILSSSNSFYHAVTAFMTVLIIACPCSVGLAIPVALTVGIGRGAKSGILIRDPSILDKFSKLDVILLDKTGTITEGKPQVIKLTTAPEITINEALVLSKTLEANSEHPLATAVMAYLPETIAKPDLLTDFVSHSGWGVSGKINGVLYQAVSQEYAKQVAQENLFLLETNHFSQIYLIANNRILARIDISDPLRSDSKSAIEKLSLAGFSVMVVSGDNQETVDYIAKTVGITKAYATCKPEDKAKIVANLQAQGKVVAFVGDGINDAPSLAKADIGIAMGGGTDIARQTASISLLRDSLSGIIDAITLGRAINANMRQNLFGSFIYNSIALLVATGAFYPFWHILLSPIIASIVMSLSSLTVIINALRLR